MDDNQAKATGVVEQQQSQKGQQIGQDEELDYATLAKLGGRKDLLVHQEYINNHSNPIPYPWVEWFDHYPPPSNEYHPITTKQTNLLAWNIPEVTVANTKRVRFQSRHRQMTFPPIHHVPHIKVKRNKTKLPSLPNEPVNFSKLLAMDYQKEWVEGNKKRLREERIRQQEKKEVQKQKLIEHTMKARKIAGVDKSEEEGKPSRFIMKRFSNIPGKLKLPPI